MHFTPLSLMECSASDQLDFAGVSKVNLVPELRQN
jgi:hypothetical protein